MYTCRLLTITQDYKVVNLILNVANSPDSAAYLSRHTNTSCPPIFQFFPWCPGHVSHFHKQNLPSGGLGRSRGSKVCLKLLR